MIDYPAAAATANNLLRKLAATEVNEHTLRVLYTAQNRKLHATATHSNNNLFSVLLLLELLKLKPMRDA